MVSCERCGKFVPNLVSAVFAANLRIDGELHSYCGPCMKTMVNDVKSIIFCNGCGFAFKKELAITVDSLSYCDECYREIFARCDVCGKDIKRKMIFFAEDGSKICSSCITIKGYVICGDCSRAFPKQMMTVVGASIVCKRCKDRYISCDDCGTRVRLGHAYLVVGGQRVCRSCHDNYKKCRDCNLLVKKEDFGWDSRCNACRNQLEVFAPDQGAILSMKDPKTEM